MLNDVQPNSELMLTLEGKEDKQVIYETIFNNDSTYLKMIDFKGLSHSSFYLLEEIEEAKKEA